MSKLHGLAGSGSYSQRRSGGVLASLSFGSFGGWRAAVLFLLRVSYFVPSGRRHVADGIKSARFSACGFSSFGESFVWMRILSSQASGTLGPVEWFLGSSLDMSSGERYPVLAR